jgi:dTDP-glucose 4,6-dehydratase
MRILITGGAGFLGSHLCDRFLAEGHQVVVMDNLITGSTANIEHLAGNNDFRFIKQDVTEYLYVEGKLDAILHFASPASPIDYLDLPIQTLKVGALGTHKTLGLAREKEALYLLASTSEVYGDPLEHPQREDYWGNVNPIGPRGVYDEAKRFAEAMTMAYHRYHGLDTRIARIFNTYGPRMRLEDGRVVPNFIAQALRGEPLTVYGDGAQTRSFCYVSDMIEGIYRLLFSSEVEPVNVGNPRELSVARGRPQGAAARHRAGAPGAPLGTRGHTRRWFEEDHSLVPGEVGDSSGARGRGLTERAQTPRHRCSALALTWHRDTGGERWPGSGS